jgi:hypothetical protein
MLMRAPGRAKTALTECRLRRELVFVDQPAEQIAAPDAVKVDHLGHCALARRRRLAERWPLADGPVRPVLVVVARIAPKDVLQMRTVDDQQPVEAFPTGASNPPLGVGARLRGPHRRFDHRDAFGAEDLVEVTRELAVAVTNERPWADTVVVELHEQVARLLAHPAAVRVGRDSCQVHAAASQLDEEQHVEALQEECRR